MSFISTRSPLDHLLAEVATAARVEERERPGRVAEALRRHVLDPRLLSGVHCPSRPDRYTRHLLQADPAGGYAVVALVWRPGQMSPVHAHRTWCSLAVCQGILTEGHYSRGAEGVPVQTGSVLRPPGSVCHGPADPNLIHRLANLGGNDAISIHVYGVAFEQFGKGVNLVYAD